MIRGRCDTDRMTGASFAPFCHWQANLKADERWHAMMKIGLEIAFIKTDHEYIELHKCMQRWRPDVDGTLSHALEACRRLWQPCYSSCMGSHIDICGSPFDVMKVYAAA